MGKTLLERIETLYGKVAAWDSRLVFWNNSGDSYDIRDVAKRLKVDSGMVADVIADAVPEPVKRGRRRAAVNEKELPDFENNA